MLSSNDIPTSLRYHKKSAVLDIIYSAQMYSLTAEFLRVYSPSAEVQRHGNPELQFGKSNVQIEKIHYVGRYGIRIDFSDGHATGIFSWNYLLHLTTEHEQLWTTYLQALETAGKSRDPHTSIVRIQSPHQKSTEQK